MKRTLKTSWTLIEGASAGEERAKEQFARRYSPVIRSYLNARWKKSSLRMEVEDAIQDVFIECFKRGGVLGRADQQRPGGFRAFFYGVVRNVALMIEKKNNRKSRAQGPSNSELDEMSSSSESPSVVFNRAWARSMMKEAAALQAEWARTKGDGAARRVEILRLRFQEEIPIREIARLWKVDSAFLHHEYAQARKEFEKALNHVLAIEHPGSRKDIETILNDLLLSLS